MPPAPLVAPVGVVLAAAGPDPVAVIGGFVCLAIVAATAFGAFLLTRRPPPPPHFGRRPEHPDDQPPGGF